MKIYNLTTILFVVILTVGATHLPVLAPLLPTLQAQERPVKEFFISVKETTINLMDDPRKAVKVWAYALEGESPSVPGPLIRVNKGDLVKIHFTNTHDIPHTMHFHGTHPFKMDGSGQRTLGREQLQLPGESFTYEWVAEDPGIYFYHCHFNTAVHIDHGMYGLFIVEDPEWPKVDRELITIWDEWDVDGDGIYDTHTINSRSAPTYVPFKAEVGEKVRLILANIGFDFHTPHLHGHTWREVNTASLASPFMENPNGVVSIGPAEIKVVEFTTQHDGTWLFHCHVVPHVADDGQYPRGMLTVLEVQAATSSGDKIIGTKDGGTADDTGFEPEGQMASIQNFQPFDYPNGVANQGYSVYNKHCKACHGEYAQGGYGPKLEQNSILYDNDRFWKTVLKGRGNMPAWENELSPQQIADVQAYLKSFMPASSP